MLYDKPEIFSKIGTQISSVHPGNTVDSYITISSFFKKLPMASLAFFIGDNSGLLALSIGVGTVIIYI